MTNQRFAQITALIASFLLSLLLFATATERQLAQAGLATDTVHGLERTLRREREIALLEEGKQEHARLQSRLLRIPPPVINAHAYLVRTTGTNEPMLLLRENKKLPIASITKLVTVLVALEILKPDDIITVTETAKAVEEKTSPAAINEQFRRDAAFRLMLALSANDIAMAVAEAAGRALGATTSDAAIRAFVLSMNNTAGSIGMGSTEFFNPTGLDGQAPEECALERDRNNFPERQSRDQCPASKRSNMSTARDLATLGEYLVKNHSELLLFAGQRTDIVTSESGLRYDTTNTNELLEVFPEVISGKTGYTDQAGETLLLITRDDRASESNIIVLLRSANRFEDGANLLRWLREFNR